VTKVSLDALGGPVFLALALVGAWFRVEARRGGQDALGLLLVWLGQFIALLAIQPFFQVSDYRVDKTFYLLVFPLALLATLPLARALERVAARMQLSARARVVDSSRRQSY